MVAQPPIEMPVELPRFPTRKAICQFVVNLAAGQRQEKRQPLHPVIRLIRTGYDPALKSILCPDESPSLNPGGGKTAPKDHNRIEQASSRTCQRFRQQGLFDSV